MAIELCNGGSIELSNFLLQLQRPSLSLDLKPKFLIINWLDFILKEILISDKIVGQIHKKVWIQIDLRICLSFKIKFLRTNYLST